ncbi:tetratricopeptide repeat protein [Roseospira navarrensis]|uniref:protein O-GlcNAc transferase n=1 Tax=Roseospira navarrensis TaxID=140058 RepID=A0A7X2D2C2_9PROT|nr:tetratricopeptide repeat protein [Roseospira navarrensis]MQX36144.1 tetratricopeptide repeat protein [Roseospira navarrensis]
MTRSPAPDVPHQTLAPRAWRLLRDGAAAPARDLAQRLLTARPADAEALRILAEVAYRTGDLDRTARTLARAAHANPDHAETHGTLGMVLAGLGRYSQALGPLWRAIALAPEVLPARLTLAAALEQAGDPDAALTALDDAVAQAPDDAEPHARRGHLLHTYGQTDLAHGAYGDALARDPGRTDCAYARACIAIDRGDHALALSDLDAVLARTPGDAEATYQRGFCLFNLGHMDESVDALRRAAGHGDAALRERALRMIAVIIPGSPAADQAEILAARRTWADLAVPPSPAPRPPGHLAGRLDGRRLRVGYVSSAFGQENWMKSFLGLVNGHDRAVVDVHLFSVDAHDATLSSYQPHPDDHFHDISRLSIEGFATLVRAEGIDVLFNLDGYTAVKLMLPMGLRPAPVNVAGVGLYGTTGISDCDYLVGDRYVVGPEDEAHCRETVLRVPCYSAFSVNYPVPDIVDPPCLTRGSVTFGCLAPQYKITPPVIDALCRILEGCPGSRLILRNTRLDRPGNVAHVRALFAARGVDPDRLDLMGPAPHRVFLETYDAIDIAIDAFPYNGGSSTIETLWQGVPLLTYDGDRWAARISASLLYAAGLDRFVAPSIDGLVETAIAMATGDGAWEALRDWRHRARAVIGASAACDTRAFAATMEAHYYAMFGATPPRSA